MAPTVFCLIFLPFGMEKFVGGCSNLNHSGADRSTANRPMHIGLIPCGSTSRSALAHKTVYLERQENQVRIEAVFRNIDTPGRGFIG